MTHKTKPVLFRAYIREGITRLPVDVQKYEIQKVADELGLEIKWYTGVVGKIKTISDERDLWSRQLRGDEAGLVHSLQVLRLTRKQLSGKDQKADFSGFMASIGGLYVMEASTGLTSTQRAKWRAAVTEVASKPPPGTKARSKAEMSKLAKQGWKTRKRGVTYTWKSAARETERKFLIMHWSSSPTAKVAHETLPEFIKQMGGGVYEELRGISEPTLRRICRTKRSNK